jgi:hypothetical protein
MSQEKIFATKTGFCHILPDKIILTRDGVIGDLAKIVTGNNINQLLFIYSAFSLVLFYLALQNYQEGEALLAIIIIIVAVLLAWNVVRSWNNSTTPVIERNQIKEIHFFPAKTGLTRAYFAVYFYDKQKNIKKRLIMLPGSLASGSQAVEEALRIMQNEFSLNIRQ